MPNRNIPFLWIVLVGTLVTTLSTPAYSHTSWAHAAEVSPVARSLGVVRFENSGKPEAQESFVQGLSALHSFFYDEAAELFRRAQAIDPDFAMAYWGEALSYNHPLWNEQDREAARATLERLGPTASARLEKAPTEREKAYLDSLEVLYGDGEKAVRDRGYARALAAISSAYPGDLDALTLHALALQGTQLRGSWSERTQILSAALLEPAFDDHPDHPGVLHYMIHAYDDPLHAPLGLRAARLYARVAPAAHHALHMPSHIFLQLGLWQDVTRSNVAAYEASVEWTKRRQLGRDKEDIHSLAWLHYAYLQQGQINLAAECLETIDEINITTKTERTLNTQALMHARHALATGSAIDPDAYAGEDLVAASVLYPHASERLAAGDVERARETLSEIEALEAGGPEVVRVGRRLTALIELADGRRSEGMETLAALADEVHALDPPSGPPTPPIPVLELYGQQLLADARHAEALDVFEDALERTPGRTPSLLGAARAAHALGDPVRAREHYRQVADNLRAAAAENPVYREAMQFLNP